MLISDTILETIGNYFYFLKTIKIYQGFKMV